MEPTIVASVGERLTAYERVESVRILWAIESGSRAWGFPSPDSDYDCRFIYIRRRSDYLSLFPKRDVLEEPPGPVFDVNGWDIAKAIKLLLKGNAVVIEWLTSPIVYRGDVGFRDTFLDLAHEVADRTLIARHYLHLAYSMRSRIEAEGDGIRLKRLFYVLRPVMALRWLALFPDRTVAPMNFRALMEDCDLAPKLVSEIESLLHKKSETREMGTGEVPGCIVDFYYDEIAKAEAAFRHAAPRDDLRRSELADRFFRAMLDRHAPPV